MTDKYVPRLKISYGVKQEVRRVRDTLERLPWYLEQGYRIDLPSGVTKDSSSVDIARAVKSEYTSIDYAQQAATMREGWKIISKGFEKIKSEPLFHLGNEYGVVLTKYGVGGSYVPDSNQVIVKIPARPQGGSAGMVVHEIMHMTIQYLIDRYCVRHWRKERLVDLLVEHYFSGLRKMQDIKEDVSVVDQAFERLYPDIDAVAKAIGTVCA